MRDPLPSSAETENVHAVRGVYREMGFVPRGTFWSFPRSIGGTSPPYRTGNSEHFTKGRVPVCWYNASHGLVQVGRCEDRLAGASGLLQRYILVPGDLRAEIGSDGAGMLTGDHRVVGHEVERALLRWADAEGRGSDARLRSGD